jgi:hypothetical protein
MVMGAVEPLIGALVTVVGTPSSGVDPVMAHLKIIIPVPAIQVKLPRGLSRHFLNQRRREKYPPGGLIHPASSILYQGQ